MIILVYPKYVGGKFISNCLSLSRHCVIQDRQLALLDIESKLDKKDYYQFKLKSVLKSLPPGKTNLRQWSKFEYGCKELYGIDEEFYKDQSVVKIKEFINTNSLMNDINSANKESCIITHDYQVFLKYLYIYPGAKIIEFDNFDGFRKLSAGLKDLDPNHINNDNYHNGSRFYHNMKSFYQFDSYTIDVDGTFFNWEKFYNMMKELYKYLEFDDFDDVPLFVFWSAYIALHQ